MDFLTSFTQIAKNIENSLPPVFEKEYNKNYYSRLATLSAKYTLKNERKLFGIMETGQITHCHELRVLYPQENLDDNLIYDWWNFICKIQKDFTPQDEMHEFSLFSLILVCRETNEKSLKILKKFKSEIKYNKKGENGWSASRMAVISLNNQNIYTNKAGSSLKNTMKSIF